MEGKNKEQNRNQWKENGKTKEKNNETRCWVFEKINRVEKPLVRLTKKSTGKTQITKIRNKKGILLLALQEKKKIIREYCKQLFTNKLGKLDEMDTFLEKHKLPTSTVYNLNTATTGKDIELVTIFHEEKPMVKGLH